MLKLNQLKKLYILKHMNERNQKAVHINLLKRRISPLIVEEVTCSHQLFNLR